MFEFWFFWNDGNVDRITEDDSPQNIKLVPLQNHEYFIYNGSN